MTGVRGFPFKTGLAVTLCATLVSCSRCSAVDPLPSPDAQPNFVSTREIVAELRVAAVRERITGRVSFHLVAERAGYRVAGFNLVFFGVPQQLLGAPPGAERLGHLGFALVPHEEQQLVVDATTGALAGELQLYADAAYLADTHRTAANATDVVPVPSLPVSIQVRLVPDEPLHDLDPHRPKHVASKLEGRIAGSKMLDLPVPAFEILLQPDAPVIDLVPDFARAVRRLCIQPVNVFRFRPPPVARSGEGLNFGMPAADREWAKVGVAFEVRSAKTLLRDEYWSLSADEEDGLAAAVRDDDCVEVFFVHEWSSAGVRGGGTTRNGATAGAQIITSDIVARHGNGRTHLAHELGHVLGLDHPGITSDGLAASSHGTLMCDSGFLVDNPERNSRHNGRRVRNPLIVFAIEELDAIVDCNDDTDCGNCPPDNSP